MHRRAECRPGPVSSISRSLASRLGWRYLAVMSVLVPVLSASLASVMTGGLTFSANAWLQRKRSREQTAAARAEIYREMIGRSLGCARRASTLRTTMRTRSGLMEGFDVTLRIRPPSDPLQLHDWFEQDADPLSRAWASIELMNAAEVLAAADTLMTSISSLLETATETGIGHNALVGALMGMAWSEKQEKAYEDATNKAMQARRDFIAAACRDLRALNASGLADALLRIGDRSATPSPAVAEGNVPDLPAPSPSLG